MSNYNENYPRQNSYDNPNRYPSTGYSGNVKIPTIKDWIIWMLLMAIPIVNLILIIVWAVDSDPENEVRRNYCRANLIVGLVVLLITFLIFIFVFLLAGGPELYY